MGEQSQVDVVSMRIDEGDRLTIEGISLDVIYTPGHTDDSYGFRMRDRVFTGDTLLIRGTGRTDFQSGDARAQYDSLFNKLLKPPDDTMVFPAHDYKGDTGSTIGEEKRHNPRLQVRSADEYAELMNNLNLANPKMMDVAVPAKMRRAWYGRRSPAAGGRSVPSTREYYSVVRISCWPIRGNARNANATARSRALCTRPVRPSRKTSPSVVCCTNWWPRPESSCCSTVRLASVPRWRCRRRRVPA
jgi:hypothetical protein